IAVPAVAARIIAMVRTVAISLTLVVTESIALVIPMAAPHSSMGCIAAMISAAANGVLIVVPQVDLVNARRAIPITIFLVAVVNVGWGLVRCPRNDACRKEVLHRSSSPSYCGDVGISCAIFVLANRSPNRIAVERPGL